ncbi:hypothetical protein LOC67_11080 [Stieleria sp. JC731]|uniref:hypothetical protein n=1 Tax=Pirellulaceae TaxID=2691357 RepID=UPI001E2E554F|nr:hypothetical protein [Stieleria sp. JC731]MCC9601090.1 hypothetical protein [Stieleria sp. JC731]
MRWLCGTLLGTLIVLVSSPLFVRSYVPKVDAPVRDSVVLKPGVSYRWRSEGYATTQIGSLGMPGKSNLVEGAELRFALWGDSQAEGVCVDDAAKIHARIEHHSLQSLDIPISVLPFARSGDDCNDWIRQIRSIERNQDSTSIAAHVFLLTEISDWLVEPTDADEFVNERINWLSSAVPAMLIQAGRNILIDSKTDSIRQLRFRPGPLERVASRQQVENTLPTELLAFQLARLRSATSKPCVFVFTSLYPAIADGKIVVGGESNPTKDSERAVAMSGLCHDLGFEFVDLQSAMTDLVDAGTWPRGFHNGQFGVGHFNAVGNDMIAAEIVRAFDELGILPRAED